MNSEEGHLFLDQRIDETLKPKSSGQIYFTAAPLSAYLLDLLSLQKVTGFVQVGLESLWLQAGGDGRAMFGVHILLCGDLKTEEAISKLCSDIQIYAT